jgi:hypothetical protein
MPDAGNIFGLPERVLPQNVEAEQSLLGAIIGALMEEAKHV